MEEALLKLFLALGAVAEQALVCQDGSKTWFKYYGESADREKAAKEEIEKLRAEIEELNSKLKGGVTDEDNK